MMKTYLSIHRETSLKTRHFITIFYLMDGTDGSRILTDQVFLFKKQCSDRPLSFESMSPMANLD